MAEKTVLVSGGFDPVHIGHVRLLNEARALGDRLVVVMNNDNWLMKKKGYAFMPEKERKEILEAFAAVDEVIISGHKENDPDMTVCREIEAIKPSIFANGGDRKNDTSTPVAEYEVCEKCGIEMKFGVGRDGKVQSSSWLVDKLNKRKK